MDPSSVSERLLLAIIPADLAEKGTEVVDVLVPTVALTLLLLVFAAFVIRERPDYRLVTALAGLLTAMSTVVAIVLQVAQ